MSDDTKLGSANDPFRALLFADQSMETLFALPHNPSPASGSPLGLFQQAHEQMTSGQQGAAKETLKKVLALPEAETRYRLWAWATLREWGDVPDKRDALRAQGLVLEVSMNSGVDTLAAYSDGTARYINHSGRTITWDNAKDSSVRPLCTRVLAAAQPLVERMDKTSAHVQPTGDFVVLTVLTFSGNREGRFQLSELDARDKPYAQVFSSATELMTTLISNASQPTKGPR